jgi:hypothetical protein
MRAAAATVTATEGTDDLDGHYLGSVRIMRRTRALYAEGHVR